MGHGPKAGQDIAPLTEEWLDDLFAALMRLSNDKPDGTIIAEEVEE